MAWNLDLYLGEATWARRATNRKTLCTCWLTTLNGRQGKERHKVRNLVTFVKCAHIYIRYNSDPIHRVCAQNKHNYYFASLLSYDGVDNIMINDWNTPSGRVSLPILLHALSAAWQFNQSFIYSWLIGAALYTSKTYPLCSSYRVLVQCMRWLFSSFFCVVVCRFCWVFVVKLGQLIHYSVEYFDKYVFEHSQHIWRLNVVGVAALRCALRTNDYSMLMWCCLFVARVWLRIYRMW